jgi:hypothetical protein
MRKLTLGIIIGYVLTTVLTTIIVGAADYLGAGGSDETQAVLGEIRIREALETIQMGRQNYLDGQVHDAGKWPCN